MAHDIKKSPLPCTVYDRYSFISDIFYNIDVELHPKTVNIIDVF